MKRVYSGYWSENDKKRRGPRITRMQVIPVVLVFAVFLLYNALSGNWGSGAGDAGGGATGAGAVRFYYAVPQNGAYEYSYADMEFPDDTGVSSMLERGMKEPPAASGFLPSVDTGVSIVKITQYGTVAEVDFSAHPAAESAEPEMSARLRAVARTVAAYYGAETVYLTVNGGILGKYEY